MNQFLFYNGLIIHRYMFPAQLCPSSGGQNCITQQVLSQLVHRTAACRVWWCQMLC